MSGIQPMGWARMPAEKGYFGIDPDGHPSLCSKLSEIFVDRMGLVKYITLEMDPRTGDKVLNFVMEQGNAITEALIEQEVNGIPVRFTYLQTA